MNSHESAIAELITKLLSHFGTVDEPLAVRRALARDWMQDFCEFAVAEVEWACNEWRRNQSMRPAIADIRRLAIQARANEREAVAERRALEDKRSIIGPYRMMKLADCRTHDDQRHYFAEAYAWMIARGFLEADAKSCRIDPEGKWHDQGLIDEYIGRIMRHDAAQRRGYEEAESRHDEIQAQNERYARAAAWREGRLDEYDARHHPERLAERQRQSEEPYSTPARPVAEVLAEMGISSKEAAQ